MNALLDRAILILKSNPFCEFVVVMPDGTKHTQGNLELVERKRRRLTHPMGTICKQYKPHLENLKVGEFVEIPYDQFSADSVQSGITAFCNQNWGKGSVTTAINRKKNCVEVLRFK